MKKSVWTFLGVFLCSPALVLAGVGASWLKVPVAPRSAALGEATVAWPGARDAAWVNPAGLALAQPQGISFAHGRWIADIRSTAFEGRNRTARGTWLLFGNIVNVPGLERRVTASSEPLGTFSVHQLQAGAGFGTVFRGAVAVGLSAKWIYEKIHLVDGGTVALDLGLATAKPAAGFRLGVSVQNLGPGYKLGNDTVDLPTVLSAGLNRSFGIFGRQEAVRTWLAWRQIRGEGGHLALGAELHLPSGLDLRAGYQTGYESRGLSVGGGLRLGRATLDYALVPFQQDLGQAHLVSLGYRL